MGCNVSEWRECCWQWLLTNCRKSVMDSIDSVAALPSSRPSDILCYQRHWKSLTHIRRIQLNWIHFAHHGWMAFRSFMLTLAYRHFLFFYCRTERNGGRREEEKQVGSSEEENFNQTKSLRDSTVNKRISSNKSGENSLVECVKHVGCISSSCLFAIWSRPAVVFMPIFLRSIDLSRGLVTSCLFYLKRRRNRNRRRKRTRPINTWMLFSSLSLLSWRRLRRHCCWRRYMAAKRTMLTTRKKVPSTKVMLSAAWLVQK